MSAKKKLSWQFPNDFQGIFRWEENTRNCGGENGESRVFFRGGNGGKILWDRRRSVLAELRPFSGLLLYVGTLQYTVP